MSHYIYVLVLLAIIGWIIWRLYSSRHSLPCPAWLSWMVELDNPFAKAHKAHEIIEALPMQKSMKALDIGCGPGRILLPLAQKIADMGGHVTGLDIQADMLDKTLLKAKKLNITNIDFIQGNINQIPIDRNYDVVLMICVLGEIPKDAHESVMKKVATHLESDGIVSITETIFDPHFQSYKTVLQLMEKMNFEKVKFIGNSLAYTAHFKSKR